jgi:tRNA dimethylallyltransferase
MPCSTPLPDPCRADGHGALVLVGPTAVGKSALALAVARRAGDVEIVTADSMQVYRGMDIGTAKPTAAERSEIPHHVLDVVDPHESYSVSDYQLAARSAIADISRRGSRALVVGGTGLYVQALTDQLGLPGQYPAVREQLERESDTEVLHRRLAGLDPRAASRMEPTNRRRIVRALEVTLGAGRPFSSFGPGLGAYPPTPHRLVGLDLPRPELDRRIEERYTRQLADGFLDEIRRLDAAPGGLSVTAAQALGYKELLAHLHGECSLEEALAVAVARTRRFARRQQRWFRRDPRIRWLDATIAALVTVEPMAAAAAVLEDWEPT